MGVATHGDFKTCSRALLVRVGSETAVQKLPVALQSPSWQDISVGLVHCYMSEAHGWVLGIWAVWRDWWAGYLESGGCMGVVTENHCSGGLQQTPSPWPSWGDEGGLRCGQGQRQRCVALLMGQVSLDGVSWHAPLPGDVRVGLCGERAGLSITCLLRALCPCVRGSWWPQGLCSLQTWETKRGRLTPSWWGAKFF